MEMAANKGTVSLVGAGPGDPELITLRGRSRLGDADVVIYDELAGKALLDFCRPDCVRVYVGKRCGDHAVAQERIIDLLIAHARAGQRVVRLKGGDPFIFGRGGEEMAELVKAGISTEVVPGITSGIAAAAYAGIPLTHRLYSSSVTFVTGHEAAGKYRPLVNWNAIAHGSETIVIYMGIHNLPYIVEQLSAAGLNLETPIALVRWGTRPEQEELIGTLETIVEQVEQTGFGAPAIAVIGQVVNMHSILSACRPV